MCSSARSPAPMHVTAAMLTPASLMAAATRASAPGSFSTSMTRSNPMLGGASLLVLGGRGRAALEPGEFGVAAEHEPPPAAHGHRHVAGEVLVGAQLGAALGDHG